MVLNKPFVGSICWVVLHSDISVGSDWSRTWHFMSIMNVSVHVWAPT